VIKEGVFFNEKEKGQKKKEETGEIRKHGITLGACAARDSSGPTKTE
jgi:hypothetical protein